MHLTLVLSHLQPQTAAGLRTRCCPDSRPRWSGPSGLTAQTGGAAETGQDQSLTEDMWDMGIINSSYKVNEILKLI